MKSQKMQKDLFIHYAFGHGLLDILSDSFGLVGEELAGLEESLHELKSRRGERLLDGNGTVTALKLERERAYEVAILRVKIACGSLLPALQGLQGAVEAVDIGLKEQKIRILLDVSVAKNNVLCARELLEVATARYYDTLHKQINSSNSGVARAIEDLYEGKMALPSARVYVIKCSYNDSKYRYDGEDGSIPPEGPHMTFEEARDAASNWIGYSNGVGDAVIQNLTTGQFYTFDGRPIQGQF